MVYRGKMYHELVRNNFDTFISKVNLPISVFYSIGMIYTESQTSECLLFSNKRVTNL